MRNLQHSLDLGLTCPVYLLFGEETLLMEQAVARIAALVAPDANAWNYETVYGDETTVEDIVLAANSGAFFAEKKLIVVRGLPWLKTKRKQEPEAAEEKDKDKRELEPLIIYARDPNPTTVLVLLQPGSVAKNSRLYKAVQAGGRAVEFAPCQGAERELWLQSYCRAAGKKLTRPVAAHICLLTAEGLTALKSEADKLLLYCERSGEITLQDAEAVVSRGAQAGVFDLTDQVAAGNGAAAAQTLRRLLIQGEAPQMLLGMLANQYRNLLAVKDMTARGFSGQEIASRLGINPYYARKCTEQGRKYAYRQLLKSLDILLVADIDGKSGKAEADDALELAILRICAL